jgi:peptide chain release factor 2
MRSEATFDIAGKQERIAALDARMAEPGFWDAQDAARSIIAEANQLKAWVEPWTELDRKARELTELAELLEDEQDPDLEAEWTGELE